VVSSSLLCLFLLSHSEHIAYLKRSLIKCSELMLTVNQVDVFRILEFNAPDHRVWVSTGRFD
jgi:hypothetical protein